MNLETALSHEGVRPDLRGQLSLANYLARAFGKSDQEIERTAADADRLVLFEQESSRREQPKATKGDIDARYINASINHFDPHWICARWESSRYSTLERRLF